MSMYIANLFIGYYWYIILIHIVLAIGLFFIVNWIGARAVSVGYMQMNIVIKEDSAPAFNFLFKVIAPVVFIVLCAVVFEALNITQFNTNIYFVVVYYWLFRILWVLCTSRGSLINWVEQIIYWAVSISLSLWVYSLLESVEQILPSPRSLLDQLWILIIVFLYSVLNKVQISRDKTIKRKNNYLSSRYITFKRKYDSLIKQHIPNEFYEVVLYSIMIYEDFNRPILVRWIEYLHFFITKKTHTLGIMQIMTDKFISNDDSIKLAIDKLIKDNNDIMLRYSDSPSPNATYVAFLIAQKYNSGDIDYAWEIRDIFEYISSQFYNKMPDSYDDFVKVINYDRVENI